MARIAGVDLPRNKHIKIALTYIFGIGNSRVGRDSGLGQCGAHQEGQRPERRRSQPHPPGHREEGNVEGDLRKDVSMHIKRLIEIGSYRGYRHRRSLPVRGQRTHTNARTRKGPRKGTVANKKKATGKT